MHAADERLMSRICKECVEHWPVWLSGLEHHPVTERLQVQFRSGQVPRLRVQSSLDVGTGDSRSGHI